MARQVMSERKAHALTIALFLVGLAILAYVNVWWPPILLVIGIPLALRQYLVGRRYDMAISLIVFLGAYITIQFNLHLQITLPVLFTIGAIHVLIREFFAKRHTEIEREEDTEKEIEEEHEEEEEDQ